MNTFPITEFMDSMTWPEIPWPVVAVVLAGAWVAVSGLACLAQSIRSGLRRRELDTIAALAVALQVREVQVEAARAQLVALCDQGRDHLAVLGAFRDDLESFRLGWDMADSIKDQSPAPGGQDVAVSALPTVERTAP